MGTRTVIAIRIDHAEVEGTAPELYRTLSRAEAESRRLFNGPPYAVAEIVFDEYDLEACSLESDNLGAAEPGC